MRERELIGFNIKEMEKQRDVEGLIKALKSEDYRTRLDATQALKFMKDKKAVEPLIQALSDENWRVRGGAAGALGSFQDLRAVNPLIKALEDEDWRVRWGAILSLEDISALENIDVRTYERIIESITPLLNDENSKVQFEAKNALWRIRGRGRK